MSFTKLNISRSKILSLALLLTSVIAFPLLKRDTIKLGNHGWYFDLTAADTTAWAGAVSTVCASGNLVVCIGETVVATLLTGIMAVGNTGPVTKTITTVSGTSTITATTTVAGEGDIIGDAISDVVTVSTDVSHLLAKAGLQLINVFHSATAALGGATSSKSLAASLPDDIAQAANAAGTILHFNSSYGQHLATQIGSNNITDLIQLITSAVPGIPSFNQSSDGSNNVVNWITYTIKDANVDINKVIEELQGVDFNQITSEITDFIGDKGDYKFCLAPSAKDDNTAPSDVSKILGEVYFNTYGPIENICL